MSDTLAPPVTPVAPSGMVATRSLRSRPVVDQPPGASDDAVLQVRLMAGDDTALATIIDRHGPVVRGAARRILADDATAAEVAQDVFVWLWEHPDRFDPTRGSLRSFLAVTVRRRAIDRIRREDAQHRALERAARAAPGAPTGDDPGDPAEAVGDQDAASRLRRAVAGLPAPQREAITLAYFGGCTYQRVAERLHIPEGTAKSRLRLGLAHLADLLTAEGLAP